MPEFSLARAGRWFLHSGIQESNGGFARYYRADLGKNLSVSTEISGYSLSALLFLARETGNSEFFDAARRTATFLINDAWDPAAQLFPFELPPSGLPRFSYFFDSGIIVRALISMWRETREQRILDIAVAAAHGMKAFWSGADYHPILSLPAKHPDPRSNKWSRSPGCYQSKSALAWNEVAEITGDASLKQAYLDVLDSGVQTYGTFLTAAAARTEVMDRLHAYLYFVEGLSPLLNVPAYRATYESCLAEAGSNLRAIAPEFVRSDVYAQLLRARVRASHTIPVDRTAAREEAQALAAFQSDNTDPRFDGGFLFGRRGGEMSPHVNPVSTTFAIQALEMWRAFEAGQSDKCLQAPI